MNKKKLIITIFIIAVISTVITYTIVIMNKSNTLNKKIEESQETINSESKEVESQGKVAIAEKWKWKKDTPENQGLNKNALQDLHRTLEDSPVNAMAIAKGGYLVDEYYKTQYNETSEFALHSTSKSITSALIGIAIDKGYIESTDVLLSAYFPEIETSGNDYQKQITLWHLLTHTSGIDMTDDRNWEKWRESENWVNYVLSQPVTERPGTTFRYSTGNTHLLSAILQKATGMTAYEFRKTIFVWTTWNR